MNICRAIRTYDGAYAVRLYIHQEYTLNKKESSRIIEQANDKFIIE